MSFIKDFLTKWPIKIASKIEIASRIRIFPTQIRIYWCLDLKKNQTAIQNLNFHFWGFGVNFFMMAITLTGVRAVGRRASCGGMRRRRCNPEASDVNGPYTIGATPSPGAYRFGRTEGVPIVLGATGWPRWHRPPFTSLVWKSIGRNFSEPRSAIQVLTITSVIILNLI